MKNLKGNLLSHQQVIELPENTEVWYVGNCYAQGEIRKVKYNCYNAKRVLVSEDFKYINIDNKFDFELMGCKVYELV